MKRFIALVLVKALLFASLIVIGAAPARAWPFHGAPTSCPFGNSFADGCAGADQTATFLNPNALTQFQQSGQTSILPSHPQPFNIAGYDYPLGPNAAAVASYKILGVDTLPSGWSYNPTGSLKGGPKLSYTSTASPTTLNGWDATFGGTTCTVVSLGGAGLGTITISNSKFALTTNCEGEAVIIRVSNAPIQIYNNIYDAHYPTATTSDLFFTDNSSGTTPNVDIKYNVFLNIGAERFFGGARGFAPRSFRYNYADSLDLENAGGGSLHGEVDLFAGGGTVPGPMSSVDWEFNTLLLQQGQPTVIDTIFYMSTGQLNNVSSLATSIVGNTVVTNKDTSGGSVDGNGLWVGGWASLGNLTITDNYFDPAGSPTCLLNGRPSQSTQNTASATGGVLSITVGTQLGTRIEVGNIIYLSGSFWGFITGLGTGTGGNGTYNVSNAATVISQTGWILAPGYTNLVYARNFSLFDGSAITFPQPAGDGQACAGHF